MPFDPISMDVPTTDAAYPARQMLITFTSHDQTLLARVFMAQGIGPHPTIIFLHGYPGTEQNFDLVHAICRSGWNVVHFHYRGAWGSSGDFSFSNVLEDTQAALDFVCRPETAAAYRIDTTKLVLIGHSMGGFAAIMTAATNPIIKGVISMAAFNFGAYCKLLHEDPVTMERAARDWGSILVPLRANTGQKRVDEVLANGESWDLCRCAPALVDKPLLLVAARRDIIAPVDLHYLPMVAAFQQANVRRLQTHLFEADHGFFQQRVALIRMVLDWLEML